jgi:hypothetical protein
LPSTLQDSNSYSFAHTAKKHFGLPQICLIIYISSM